MSKLSSEALEDAVQAILQGAQDKKRKFVETIELQVALKNYDPQKDKRFSGTVRLPNTPKPRFTVCVIGDAKHVGDCEEAKVPCKSVEDLKRLNKNKKLVKKLANEYDAFLASASLIRKIPRILGPGLNKAGKFPSVLAPNDDIPAKILEAQQLVKFQLKSKKALCLGLAVANCNQSKEDVIVNITLAINFMVSLLPKGWQQVKRVYIKSTMGPSFRIHGF